ncbi:MAG: hypothetical protein AAB363_07705 [Planctomycetota bacterium]
MTHATSDAQVGWRLSPDEPTKYAVQHLEELLVVTPDRGSDAAYFTTLSNEFRRLHARIRAHHAADCLETPSSSHVLPAELTQEWDRLREEHTPILGMLDWLIRHVESIADQGTEDKDVFILRVKELIAVLRRHDAEEDRLYDIALWKDTGGES